MDQVFGSTPLRFIVAMMLFLAGPCGAADTKPNIVLVFLDNFGWGEPGFNGGGIIRGAETPRLDQLAAWLHGPGEK